ncbi:hypothetical protein Pmar_PMAR029349 [Perkinsus marinus ATCC 50983]|uniref:Uncharacterized protein n=1 Tax=Perkinsus marinus (strain ATCC 50983 / TXsc) TaxID=423536 RepID=C5KMW9_PERM5|nr:hypothetical protein Pmar_PMAR029349 [Perkinsus marinus ATCC 50983]EER14277.1 hypothetical protein Pmar_PMAR029349 [Perkinsus marinus ATCC 50983]|eukprot:XP_002782482.1 hypothetical protein Pmar_PMAR029349 [Perkinsus marinus ATCC 50983]
MLLLPSITQHFKAANHITTWYTNYQLLLKSRPYLSNTVTAAGLMLLGDVLAQREKKLTTVEVKYDPYRTLAMVISTALVTLPYVPFMRFLDRVFPNTFIGALQKSILNASTAAVVSNSWIVYTSTTMDALLKGETVVNAKRLGKTALAQRILGVAAAEVLLMIALIIFTCGAWSNNGPVLQWLTVLIFFFSVYITDLVFFPVDKNFIHDPFYSTYSKLTDPHYETNPYN